MTPITLNIPAAGAASGVATFQGSGKYFLLSALTGPVRIVTNHNEEFDFTESNSGFGNDLAEPFGKLTFYNDAGAPIQVTFYISNSPIKTSDVNVTSSITVTANTSSPIATSAETVPGQFLQTTTVAAGPVALNLAGTFATFIVIQAQKTVAHPDNGGTANAGKVFIGFSNVNGAQPIELSPGDQWTFSAGSGRKVDLGKFFLDVLTDNDGVVVLYY